MTRFRISEAARLLAVSDDTVRRWIDQGRLRAADRAGSSGRQMIDGADLARLALELGESAPETPGSRTPSTARNHFPGIVTAVKKDSVMAQVDIQAGPFRVVSLISAEAAEELGLEVGVAAVASIKATNVVLDRPGARDA
ncbi:TOBE domain-containing protein [Saxibacter everestensis]|uniref:TOBE domain-containing protein n=1 Tax=Saxibacter everestensis TaxID=2909229 RepID=A0ABY8QSR1_9MICO|nr:TOBE domain-containing protein [Brevibacteriaceae bacterium ZFBP1038]